MMAGQHLQPDRQPVDKPGGDAHGRAAVEVGRRSQRRLVHDGPDEPDLVNEVPTGKRGGRRSFRHEGHIRMRRAEHEVGLVEQVSHRSIELPAVPLDRSRALEVVALPGALEPGCHLGRQLFHAIRVGVAQVGHEGGLVRHSPRATQWRQRRSHGDKTQTRRPGQVLGAGLRQPRPRPPGPARSRGRPGSPRSCRTDRGCRARPPTPPPGAGSADHDDRNRCRRRSSGPCRAPTGSGTPGRSSSAQWSRPALWESARRSP